MRFSQNVSLIFILLWEWNLSRNLGYINSFLLLFIIYTVYIVLFFFTLLKCYALWFQYLRDSETSCSSYRTKRDETKLWVSPQILHINVLLFISLNGCVSSYSILCAVASLQHYAISSSNFLRTSIIQLKLHIFKSLQPVFNWSTTSIYVFSAQNARP